MQYADTLMRQKKPHQQNTKFMLKKPKLKPESKITISVIREKKSLLKQTL